MPTGRELDFAAFTGWFERYRSVAKLAQPTYDFMVVDEVQDLTSVQLALLLKTLAKPGQFLLCGDSNQIVHPNFFSWAAVRAQFQTPLVFSVHEAKGLEYPNVILVGFSHGAARGHWHWHWRHRCHRRTQRRTRGQHAVVAVSVSECCAYGRLAYNLAAPAFFLGGPYANQS